nr:hypothetical protein [Pseudomonas laurylsulfativorans]
MFRAGVAAALAQGVDHRIPPAAPNKLMPSASSSSIKRLHAAAPAMASPVFARVVPWSGHPVVIKSPPVDLLP